MMQTTITIILLSLIGFIAGLLIFLASKFHPKEDESLEETARIKEFLPGADCGACGSGRRSSKGPSSPSSRG